MPRQTAASAGSHHKGELHSLSDAFPERQTGGQKNRLTVEQTDERTCIHTYIHRDRHIDRQTDIPVVGGGVGEEGHVGGELAPEPESRQKKNRQINHHQLLRSVFKSGSPSPDVRVRQSLLSRAGNQLSEAAAVHVSD